MKLKVDENLPIRVVEILRELDHDAHTALDEGLKGASDARLWRAAQVEDRILLTQDLDFSDERLFAPGTHAGIILVRLRMPSRVRIAWRIEEVFRCESVEAWIGCFVVVTDRKVRVRRPPSVSNPA
jgi:predicted nuclease of predicted toxin-antitoxin system